MLAVIDNHCFLILLNFLLPAPDSLNIEGSRDAKNSISTPDVISIILGSPNTTPMLKRGDKVGDPFSTQHKDEQVYGFRLPEKIKNIYIC